MGCPGKHKLYPFQIFKMERNIKSKSVMLSKRANVFYLEHVRVMQKNERVVYLTEAVNGIQQFVSIPDKNTTFILLGKGTSITDSAVRKLAESNVVIGFCGSGGSPLFADIDIAFLTPQDEYRPTEYGQKWFEIWSNEKLRINLAKHFLIYRGQKASEWYANNNKNINQEIFNKLIYNTKITDNIPYLCIVEAHYVKSLDSELAKDVGIRFTREQAVKKSENPAQKANSFLDHGNYIAYGYASVALHGLGIPYFLPILHGKTRRGALVFDVADLFKDYLVMPLAFEMSIRNAKDTEFRAKIIDSAQNLELLDDVMTFLKTAIENI